MERGGFFRYPAPRAMSSSLPLAVPSKLAAGSTWRWERRLPSHPASDGWSLTYHFRGPGKIDVAATPSGDHHLVVATAASTAELPPGPYRFKALAERDGEVVEVDEGLLSVTENFATLQDGLTYNQRMLAAIEARLEGRITADAETFQINGRAVSRIPLPELMKARSLYAAMVADELGIRPPALEVVFL